MDIEEKVEAIEEKANDRSLAYEILQELKQSSKRWCNAFFTVLILWALTIGGFLWYLNQYDYTSSIEATGIFTAVDQSGNIVAQDVTADQWDLFMEWMNGNGSNKNNQNTN